LDARGRGEELNAMGILRIAFLLTAGALVGCGEGAPDIDVVDSYDMGTIVKGELAIADLAVQNRGDGPLTVVGVSTSCGCTTATLMPMVIPADGAGRLHIEYDSTAHESDIGRIDRSIFISSNDPDEDDVQIRFTIFVQASAT
jgi:hypothetical protein